MRLALAEEAKASHHKHARHNVLLIVKFLHLTHRFFSPLTGRPGGSLYNSDDSPLVLWRAESPGKAREQDNSQDDKRDERGAPPKTPRQYPHTTPLTKTTRTTNTV